MKLWKKDYDVNFEIESYCTDNDYVFDQRLVPYDCKASIAHATMLNKIGIINKQELKLLILGLNEIITLHKDSKFIVKKDDEITRKDAKHVDGKGKLHLGNNMRGLNKAIYLIHDQCRKKGPYEHSAGDMGKVMRKIHLKEKAVNQAHAVDHDGHA